MDRQVTAMPGNMVLVDYGQEQYDVVWFGNVLYFFDPAGNIALLRKTLTALAAGGTVVIKAPLPDEARHEREFPLLVATWLFATSTDGDAYTFSQYERFLEQAGFVGATEVSEQLIKAVKPSYTPLGG